MYLYNSMTKTNTIIQYKMSGPRVAYIAGFTRINYSVRINIHIRNLQVYAAFFASFPRTLERIGETLVNSEQLLGIIKDKILLQSTPRNGSKYVNTCRKLNAPTPLWLFDNRTKAKRGRKKDYTNQSK